MKRNAEQLIAFMPPLFRVINKWLLDAEETLFACGVSAQAKLAKDIKEKKPR
jgi:hypothetical protein